MTSFCVHGGACMQKDVISARYHLFLFVSVHFLSCPSNSWLHCISDTTNMQSSQYDASTSSLPLEHVYLPGCDPHLPVPSVLPRLACLYLSSAFIVYCCHLSLTFCYVSCWDHNAHYWIKSCSLHICCILSVHVSARSSTLELAYPSASPITVNDCWRSSYASVMSSHPGPGFLAMSSLRVYGFLGKFLTLSATSNLLWWTLGNIPSCLGYN